MKITIKGIGPVGAFGHGMDDFKKMLTGETTVIPETVRIKLEQRDFDLPLYRASTSGLEDFFPKRSLRRIDHFSGMALFAACLAIEDAGIKKEELKDAGLIIATAYGPSRTTFAFLDSFLENGDSASQPTHFSNSVHNAAAAHISMKLGIKGPGLTVSQFDLSFTSAIITACNWLLEKRVKIVLLGCVDEYCDVLGYTMASFMERCENLKAISPNLKVWKAKQSIHEEKRKKRRDDKSRYHPNYSAGEGACFFVLKAEDGSNETKDSSSRYGWIKNAEIFHLHDLDHKSDFHDKSLISDIKQPIIMGSKDYDNQKQGQDYIENSRRENSFAELIKSLEKNFQVFSFSHLYGHFPTNLAFDLSVAALFFTNCDISPMFLIEEGEITLHVDNVYCVKPCKNSLYSLIKIVNI